MKADLASWQRLNSETAGDGTSLDSDDHASHLVASTNGANGRPECPSTHPVHVPEVTLQAQYPAAATGGAGVTLASGGPTTLHADIFEAWGR